MIFVRNQEEGLLFRSADNRLMFTAYAATREDAMADFKRSWEA
jgi:hypothetical protein